MTPFYLFIIGIAIAIYPLISMLIASAVGSLLDISVGEGPTDNYFIGKWNLGQTLQTMFCTMWLIFFTVPIGAVIIIISGIWQYFV